jgi:glutathione S-transferase
MLRIYDYKGFPNPTRVRIALAEKGAFRHGRLHFDRRSARRTQAAGVCREKPDRHRARA